MGNRVDANPEQSLVEQFRQQDATGRMETLMNQLSEVQEERDNLAKKVKNIENIISDNAIKEEPDVQESVSLKLKDNDRALSTSTSDEQITTLPIDETIATSSSESSPYNVYNKEYAAYIDSSSRASWAASTLRPVLDEHCECSANSSALDPSQRLNKWRYANDTLTEWFKWSPQALDMTRFTAYNDDIPVRAMVEGWDAVEKTGNMHPAWKLLRGIDENIFISCDPRERLAILAVMGLLLQAHLNPTTEQHKKLPSFYLKRPSQDMLHSYATEYFAWPGLRERFVFSEHRYCSNLFWKLFCKGLRLQWAYEFRDCYVRNTETGLYRISPTFNERIMDIRAWTMGRDMFKQYPELYNDMPTNNHIPASLGPVSLHPVKSKQRIGAVKNAMNEQEEIDSQLSHYRVRPSSRSLSLTTSQQLQPTHSQYENYPTDPPQYRNSSTPLASYPFHQDILSSDITGIQQMQDLNHWMVSARTDTYQLGNI